MLSAPPQRGMRTGGADCSRGLWATPCGVGPRLFHSEECAVHVLEFMAALAGLAVAGFVVGYWLAKIAER